MGTGDGTVTITPDASASGPVTITPDAAPLSMDQIRTLLPGATDTLVSTVYANPEKYRSMLGNAAAKQPKAFWDSIGTDVPDVLKLASAVSNPVGAAGAAANIASRGEGAAYTAGSDILGTLKSIPNIVGMVANPAQAALDHARQIQRQDPERQAAGRSLGYRAAAAIGTIAGVDPTGSEESAKSGDVAGVLGHTVVPLATAVLAAHGAMAPDAGAAVRAGEAVEGADAAADARQAPIIDAATEQLERRSQIAKAHEAPPPTVEAPQPEAAAPKYAYRVRDVGEDGIPSQSHSQATMSEDEARSYAESRGNLTGNPQELVRVDLNKTGGYNQMPGPNGADWIKFNQTVPENLVEDVPEKTAQTPPANAGVQTQPAAQPTVPPTAAGAPPRSGNLPAQTQAAITPNIADALTGQAAVRAAANYLAPIEPYSGITRAIKPGTNLTGWNQALKDAMPDLLNAEKDANGNVATPTYRREFIRWND